MIERSLLQRIATALVLAPLAVWGILALPLIGFALIAGLILALGAWEWARIAGLPQPWLRMGYTLLFAMLAFALFPHVPARDGLPFALTAGALLWWAAALLVVLRFPRGSGFWQGGPLPRVLAGLVILLPTWLALVTLHGRFGPPWVLVLMLLVWGADTGAYFAGRRFGRHKLAPRVSPGKTVEGLWGALAVSALVAVAAGVVLDLTGAALGLFVALSLATVLISVLGDLVESMFKRISGIKDSSGLLPGHGGVLDRIDSVCAAAPLFATGLWLLHHPA